MWLAVILATLIAGNGPLQTAGWASALLGVALMLGINLYYFGSWLAVGNPASPTKRPGMGCLALALLPERLIQPVRAGCAKPGGDPERHAKPDRSLANNPTIKTVHSDSMPVALAWSLAMWAVCLWAGWAVRRHNQALAAILPAAVLIAAVLNYTRDKPLNLALLLALFPVLDDGGKLA